MIFYDVLIYYSGSDSALLDDDNAILRYGHQFADYLGRGLADNWSQVNDKCVYSTSVYSYYAQFSLRNLDCPCYIYFKRLP